MQSGRALSTLATGYFNWHQCQQAQRREPTVRWPICPVYASFLLLFRCFSRLAQENIFLSVCFLARALNSGANGVVYMKCRGRTGDQEGAEPRRRPEKAAHIGWRRGFARRIITSLTSLGLVVGMNNIATAEFSLHVVLQRGGSRLCRWLLWNSAVSGGRSETDVVIDAFRWKKEKGVAKQETAKTNILHFQQNSV